MKIETAKLLERAACEVEHDISCDVRESYSGRGMYGKETAAVVVNGPLDVALLAAYVVKAKLQAYYDRTPPDSVLDSDVDAILVEFCLEMRSFRYDSMGRDSVVVY